MKGNREKCRRTQRNVGKHKETQGNTEKSRETQRNAGKHRETHTHRYQEASVMDKRRVQEEEYGIAYSSKLIC